MRESQIENYLVERAKALGGECRKLRWIGRNGAPDRLVMLPDRTVWIELKAEGLAAFFPHTPHERQQHREHERMRKMGQRVEIVDSCERVDEVLA